MSRVRADLHARRARLVARSDLQRDEMGQETKALGNVIAAADLTLGVVTFLRGRDLEPSLEAGMLSPQSWPLRGVRWLLRRRWVWLWLRGFFGYFR